MNLEWINSLLKCGGPLAAAGAALVVLSIVLFLLSIDILPPGFRVGRRFRPRLTGVIAAVCLLVGVVLFFSAEMRCGTDGTGLHQRLQGERRLSIKLDLNNCRFDEGELCLTSETPLGLDPTAVLNWVDDQLQLRAEQWILQYLALRDDALQIETLPVYFKVISAEAFTPPNSPTHVIAYAQIDTQRVSATIDKIIAGVIFTGSSPPGDKAPSAISQGAPVVSTTSQSRVPFGKQRNRFINYAGDQTPTN